MDASAEERARRRHTEVTARGEQADYDMLLQKMIERDRIDSTRAVAPLRPADDALILNTDKMSETEVYDRIMELCK
jgi:cytidylate kinase